MELLTERLIIDNVRETDKADYFDNISHDKVVYKELEYLGVWRDLAYYVVRKS